MAHVGSKVRAIYDFSGQHGTSELSIAVGEILTLTRQDVGEGWWEGVNQSGLTGLFPAAYVEEIENGPPAMPPPPPPASIRYAENFGGDDAAGSSEAASVVFEAGDYWDDDDWDDDVENGAPSTSQGHGVIPPSSKLPHPRGGSIDEESLATKTENMGIVPKKTFNRFTRFGGKPGLDNFILNAIRLDVLESEKIYIEDSDIGVVWNPITEPYTCVVSCPKKESKLKGLKSFIAYQITPTFNNIQVSRRYKHFDWLHERLGEKFSLIPIPPLPDKQISGRYEEHFIEHRRMQLQAFVNSMCRHPVLSRCSVWQHFITCTDDKRWKSGKRKEEKDKLLGANYLFALQVPHRPLEVYTMEQDNESCLKYMHNMDGAIKSLMATAADQTKKHQGPYKREYMKIGHAFLALGVASDDGSTTKDRVQLTKAIKLTGETYNEIGILFEEQPKLDWAPLSHMLHLYRGIISSFPDILHVHKSTMSKRKECERSAQENRMEECHMQEVLRRTDLVSFALLAEINHFHTERTLDFKENMKNYLSEQILFYQKIVSKLQEAHDAYDK